MLFVHAPLSVLTMTFWPGSSACCTTQRSLHDALCVIRCLVHKRALIPGGAAPEMEVEHALTQWAKSLQVCAAAMTLCL